MAIPTSRPLFLLLEPAPAVPVAAEIGGILRHDHEVALADLDVARTAGAFVALPGGVGLNEGDDLYPEKAAHATNARAMRIVAATRTMSNVLRSCCRNGLKPTAAW
jgi:hypothetical protein